MSSGSKVGNRYPVCSHRKRRQSCDACCLSTLEMKNSAILVTYFQSGPKINGFL